MTQLNPKIMVSPHFALDELICKCGCGRYNLKPRLLRILELIRIAYGHEVFANSACRCPKHNLAVGGGPEHPEGEAVDVRTPNMVIRHIVLQIAYKEGVPRVGIAEGFIHLGISSTLAQAITWTYPAKPDKGTT